MDRLSKNTNLLSGNWDGVITSDKGNFLINCNIISDIINNIGQIEGYGSIQKNNNRIPISLTGIFGLKGNVVHLFENDNIYHLNLNTKNLQMKGKYINGTIELYKISDD